MVGLKWLLLWCLWLTIPRIPSTKNVGKTYRFLCWCHRELQQCMATFLKRWIGMEVQSIRANKCQGKGWGVIYLMRCSLQVLQVKVWISVKAEWKYEVIKMLPRIWMKIKTVYVQFKYNMQLWDARCDAVNYLYTLTRSPQNETYCARMVWTTL